MATYFQPQDSKVGAVSKQFAATENIFKLCELRVVGKDATVANWNFPKPKASFLWFKFMITIAAFIFSDIFRH